MPHPDRHFDHTQHPLWTRRNPSGPADGLTIFLNPADKTITPAILRLNAWEPETTARNLRLIREAREKRQETVVWAIELEKELGLRGEDK